MRTITSATESTMKLTQRTFLTDVIAAMSGEPTAFSMDELRTFAEGRIAQLDAEAARRKAAPRKLTEKAIAEAEAKAAADAAIVDACIAALAESATPMTRSELAVVVGATDAKVSTVLRAAVADGRVLKTEVKAQTASGKAGKRTAYTVAKAE